LALTFFSRVRFVNARRRFVKDLAAKKNQADVVKAIVEGKPLPVAATAETLPYVKRRGGFEPGKGPKSRSSSSSKSTVDDADRTDDAQTVSARSQTRKEKTRAESDEDDDEDDEDEQDEDEDNASAQQAQWDLDL